MRIKVLELHTDIFQRAWGFFQYSLFIIYFERCRQVLLNVMNTSSLWAPCQAESQVPCLMWLSCCFCIPDAGLQVQATLRFCLSAFLHFSWLQTCYLKVMIHEATFWAMLPGNVAGQFYLNTFTLQLGNKISIWTFLIILGNFLRTTNQNTGGESYDLLQATDQKFQTIIAPSQCQWDEEMAWRMTADIFLRW